MVYVLLFLIMAKICVTYSFLLTNSTATGLNSFEYQHLSQLIYNGQSRITTLEQELMTVKTIHDIALKDMDLRHKNVELQLNATNAELNVTEKELSVTKVTLDEQVRTAGYIKLALEKEKINRHQLQQQYSGLINDFQNLSRSCHDDIAHLNQRVKDVESQSLPNNVNKNITDLLKWLENVERLQTHVSNSTDLSKISTFDTNVSEIMTDISAYHRDITQLQLRTGYQSGFTVRAAQARMGPPGSGTTIFPLIQSNVGAHYKVSTGQFTCVYPGTYFFSLSLYKHVSVSQAFCSIRKNGSGVVQANSYVGGTNSGGNNEASTSIVLHLVRGDTVDLGSCSSPSFIENYSTFSGVLLRAD